MKALKILDFMFLKYKIIKHKAEHIGLAKKDSSVTLDDLLTVQKTAPIGTGDKEERLIWSRNGKPQSGACGALCLPHPKTFCSTEGTHPVSA